MSYFMSCHMSCHVICHVMSYVMSCHMSCHVICHVMSYVMSCHMSCHVMSYVMSCHVSCQMVCADHFELRGKAYFVIVDRFSGWPELACCGSTTGSSSTVIRRLRDGLGCRRNWPQMGRVYL